MREHKDQLQVAENSNIEDVSNGNPELKKQYINSIRKKYSVIVAEGNSYSNISS